MAEAPLNRNAIRRISFHVFRLSVLLLAFARSAWGGGIGLAWDSVDSPSIAGYMVYYGPSAGTYTGKIDVAKQTAYTISNLPDGATYHFTVTAYDASRVESSFSNDAVGTAGAGASGSTRAEAVTTTVVEYFNPSLAQYFMTSDSNEISVLDEMAASKDGRAQARRSRPSAFRRGPSRRDSRVPVLRAPRSGIGRPLL